MPAIAASGQVYVLNGAITVNSGAGGYLATGSPLMYITAVVCPIGVTNHTFTIPSGARAIVMNSARSLNKCAISAYGASSLLNCLFVTSNGSGPLAAQLPTGTDTQVTVQVTNSDIGSQTLYFWWAFSLDDYGATSLNQANTYRPPLGYGKYSMIANDRVPTRFGDDSQDPSRANFGCLNTGSGTIIAAPGVGYSLVLWETAFLLIPNAATGIITINDGTFNWDFIASNSDAKTVTTVHGGIRMPTNTGLTCSYFNCANLSQAQIKYTVELT
jgi:hypothetical protein